MGYPYEDLAETQFEALVVQAAKLLLGKGVQGFALGVDGGRDARFEGIADGFPSYARPWTGISIIQAKHTMSYGYFNDPDFGGDAQTSVVSIEVKRARKLRLAGKLDNYLLYSNRYLTANANEKLIGTISTSIGVPEECVRLCGIEALDEAFRLEPRLADLAGINPLDGPLIVSSRELAEVVEAISISLNEKLPSIQTHPVNRTSLNEKNDLNSMSQETSDRLMKNYSHLLRQIKEFLADPGNSKYRDMYDSCAEDFDLKIVAYKEERHSFDKVFSQIVELLTKRDSLLGRNRRLTRAIVFYMYWNCDIGETEEKSDVIPVEA
ncbi:ABC-three component system protein [Bifidobacterium psychraerophilum]|uniref:Periplasmic binding protein/LacI transcriptional regulator n=1 Tax=Bifidobacterium psychraerophilum TaxID=218140 RepID=A0A087CCP5_9BIFI|nr:ABC-three component system protein [Bifidobacterium psychraerophilum]KFI81045.1 periplasmic binding protein/LacI transcriptional regulator [Bifidobacterium psychraerophilum]PKA95390.1 hypothetical protein A9A89_1655 [Bifidobacterium psychraerophilum DSM 22366]